MTAAQDGRGAAAIVDLIDHTASVAGDCNRADLIARLAEARRRITDPTIRVVIAGQLKQGKSQLLNSLLNMPVARVGDDESTVAVTVVGHAETAAARIVVDGGPPTETGGDTETGATELPVGIALADLQTDLRRAPATAGRALLRVEVGVPSPLLAGGLTFVDTPGAGGHGPHGADQHLSATLGLLPDADAVLFVSDASQEFTEPEMRFLRQAVELCPVAAVVATKIDLYPYWRQVVAADSAHLQRAGLDIPVIGVSALLRSHALAGTDRELSAALNEESNFPAVVEFLARQVLAPEANRTRGHVLDEIAAAAEHLSLVVGTELAALQDPEQARILTAELERRKRDAEEALAHTALWQQVLADGIADLTADVEYDLRARLRAITERAEAAIDSGDPTLFWAETSARVEEEVAAAVGDNFVWAHRRALALAEQVARTFVDAGLAAVEIPELSAREMGADLGRLTSLARLESKPVGKGHKAITSLRGSYGGVLMFGMLTSMAGLGMFNPISLGAGLLLGRKAYREDMDNRMLRVRGEAKTNLRRFVDDVLFVVTKESRDRLKLIQRRLRDHYREIAAQATRSLNESLQSAIAAAQVKQSEHATRTRELERRRDILRQVLDNAGALR
ncbi:MAG: Isoniazid-inducible protein iniA [Mycobacterium sp.]|nr:MAG: Isoniazid-inducible protein iniA [Mycobacterium sp.]